MNTQGNNNKDRRNKKPKAITASHRLAPDDIDRDMYVTISGVIVELVPCPPSDGEWKGGIHVKRIRLVPGYDSGDPMKVIDICLPFVFVCGPNQCYRTLDVRRHQLSRLPDRYARKVLRCYDEPDEKQRKKTRRRKKSKKQK